MRLQLATMARKSSLAGILYHSLRGSWHLYRHLRARCRRPRIRSRYLTKTDLRLLQLGSGPNGLPGWLNTDIAPLSADVMLLDATRTFPLPEASFAAVYSEHQIEHLRMDEGLAMLRESYRVLEPGGRIRIATPDLMALVRCLECAEDSDAAHYVKWMYHRHIADEERSVLEDTGILPAIPSSPAAALACRILNNAHHNWGHRFLYDEWTLKELLQAAGLFL